LKAVPGLGGARLVRTLGAGPTNASYLVEHEGQQWVLRIDRPQAAELGLDRESERQACETVAAAGMTPAYRYFDAAAGICLRPFLEGDCLPAADLHDPVVLEELARVLRRLHALPAVGRRFDPLAAARQYARELGTAEAADLADRAGELIDQATDPGAASVLCHNDLVAENILRVPGRELVLIDWEYAGIGDPYFDLAVVVRHHGLGEALAQRFLADYLGRAPGDDEQARLAAQCDFYGCLLALWNQRVHM
jgi:thiamine kinase-like enzyme